MRPPRIAPAVCLLIVRGEAFRHGGHHSRLVDGQLAAQVGALATLREHVIAPLHNVGWDVRAALDVSCGSRASEFATALSQARVVPHALRAEKSIEMRQQPANVRRSCEWARQLCLSAAERESASTLVIVTRIDMRWKRSPLAPIPEPAGIARLDTLRPSVVGLWDCVPRKWHPERRLVNDVFFFMTAATLAPFFAALRTMQARGDVHMHDLPAVFDGAVRVLRPEHINANPEKMCNDYYTFIGRPQALDRSRARVERVAFARGCITPDAALCVGESKPKTRILQLMR